jgi:hypothetical protein
LPLQESSCHAEPGVLNKKPIMIADFQIDCEIENTRKKKFPLYSGESFPQLNLGDQQ